MNLASAPFEIPNFCKRMDNISKRKVLFVIDTLQIGGAEQSLLSNTTRFDNIIPIICHIYKGDLLKQKFIENGIKVYSIDLEKKFGFVKAYRELKKVVSIEQPDLIVGYITRSEIVARLVGRFNHIPVIGTFITDLYSKTYNQHLSWKAKQLVSLSQLINKLTCKVCVGFVANSQAIKDSNAQYLSIPPNKIKVINRGRESIHIKRKQPVVQEDAWIRFVNVSRLYPVKGHKELLLGFNNFLQKHPQASLHIVGDGPQRAELTKIIRQLGLEDKVFLLGARNDVGTLLADFDCFVFPSLEEGFSGAVVEAMFANIPVLASDIGPNKEAITHLKTGYLFKRESAEEIEKSMLWFKDNKATAQTFALNAYHHAKEHFELSIIVEQFEQYLLSVMEY